MRKNIACSFFFASAIFAGCGGSPSTSPGPSPAPVPTNDKGSPAQIPYVPIDARQQDRDVSLFTNLDFENLDESGAPVGWTCTCPTTAKTACKVTNDAAHGAHALVLESGCVAMQATTTFDGSKAVRADYFARGSAQYSSHFYLMPSKGTSYGEMIMGQELPETTSWTKTTADTLVRTQGADRILLMVTNGNGSLDMDMSTGALKPDGKPLYVDDIVAVQDAPNPAPQSASILSAQHFEQLGLTAGAADATLFTPLPIDYASQVPLYVELKVDPPSAVDHVEYVMQDEHDWGAIVHLAPSASAPTLTFSWDAIVLTRIVPHEEIPAVYTKMEDPSLWTHPSAIIESDYAPLVAQAKSLVSSDATAEQKMNAVIGWTSKTLGGAGTETGLDARSVFDSHATSCTGFANTAAAMGRALGVPSRHLTNILVGESQDMHSIDEFWLGDALGWRRVEPQQPMPYVNEDLYLAMRVVLPTDEVETPQNFKGVPANEFTQWGGATERLSYLMDAHVPFYDCSSCINRADRRALLRDAQPDVVALLALARAKWAEDVKQYAAGGPSAERIAARRKAMTAKTLADLQTILSTLP